VEGEGIRFGLVAVKGIGAGFIRAVVSERTRTASSEAFRISAGA
jgi:DNA polymerase III alpha subunit